MCKLTCRSNSSLLKRVPLPGSVAPLLKLCNASCCLSDAAVPGLADRFLLGWSRDNFCSSCTCFGTARLLEACLILCSGKDKSIMFARWLPRLYSQLSNFGRLHEQHNVVQKPNYVIKKAMSRPGGPMTAQAGPVSFAAV